MKTFTPAVAIGTLFLNNTAGNSPINLAAKTVTQLLLVPVTSTNGSALYEQMGIGSDGHTVSWKLRGIGASSAAGTYSTPEVWKTGDAVPTGNVFPKRIQIYVL